MCEIPGVPATPQQTARVVAEQQVARLERLLRRVLPFVTINDVTGETAAAESAAPVTLTGEEVVLARSIVPGPPKE